MHKTMAIFLGLASLSMVAMEIESNKEDEVDADVYTNKLATEQQQHQVRAWLLQNQKISKRRKLHESTCQEIVEWANKEIKSKKAKNAQQYMTIGTFEASENLYRSVPCKFEKKQWNDQTELYEPTGKFKTRYLVRDVGSNTVYKKRLKATELPGCMQEALKTGRARAIEKNKFFFGDFKLPDDNDEIKVYANKDMLDIFTEEVNRFYDFDLRLKEERYFAIKYATKFIEGLPEDPEEYDEFIIVKADEQEEVYICKTGQQYYLFGVLLPQYFSMRDGVYSIEVNGKIYKLADKLMDFDQKTINKIMNIHLPLTGSSSEEISSESGDDQTGCYSPDIGDNDL